MKKLLPYLFAFIAIVACSKDDSPETQQPTVITGGEAFKGEVVTIDMPEGSLGSDEYPATFNGVEVTVVKASPTELVYLIPSSTPVGVYSLSVPALSLTVNYDVKEVVLPGTPEEVVNDLVNDFDTYLSIMTDAPGLSDVQDAIDSFNAYFENATPAEKAQIAAYYFVNKSLFDEILLDDYSSITGREVTASDILAITKHKLAVIAMVAGSFAVLYGVTAEKVLGGALAIAGAVKAKAYFFDIAEKLLSTDGLEMSGESGMNDRNVNAIPVFNDNTAKTVSFKTKARKLTAADGSRTQPNAVKLFSMYNKYNWCANKINIALTWLNNNIPFVNFNLVPLEQFAATAPLTGQNINANTFDNITFSVNDPDVTLVSANLVGSGQISLKFSIEGTPSTFPVEAMLNYSYTDEFNTFTGKFPIQVTNELLCEQVTDVDGNLYNVIQIGSHCWTTKNLTVSHYRNGDVIPQIQNYQQWANATSGAWCYYENQTANGTVYGKMYNWYAVNDPRGLAPEGYHIPTEDEMNNLIQAAGGGNNGAALSGLTGWVNPSQQPTNSTGFNALPGGFRMAPFDGNIGSSAMFWSTTQYPSLNQHGVVLQIVGAAGAYTQPREYYTGAYVRCVKD